MNQRDVTRKFSDVTGEIKPHIVFIPHEGDIHMIIRIQHMQQWLLYGLLKIPALRHISLQTLSETEWSTPNPKNFSFLMCGVI